MLRKLDGWRSWSLKKETQKGDHFNFTKHCSNIKFQSCPQQEHEFLLISCHLVLVMVFAISLLNERSVESYLNLIFSLAPSQALCIKKDVIKLNCFRKCNWCDLVPFPFIGIRDVHISISHYLVVVSQLLLRFNLIPPLSFLWIWSNREQQLLEKEHISVFNAVFCEPMLL